MTTTPTHRTQTHSPASAATDYGLPSGLDNLEDLRIEVLGDLFHLLLKHEVQNAASTTFFAELQEFGGLLPGCFFSLGLLFQEFHGLLPGCLNVHDHLADLLRDLLLHQAFLRHHLVNLHPLLLDALLATAARGSHPSVPHWTGDRALEERFAPRSLG